MTLRTINILLIIAGLLTVAAGLRLHIGYHAMLPDHEAMLLWVLLHVVFATATILLASWHIAKNKWWFKTLRIGAKTARQKRQRVATPLCVLLFLALVATGACILFGWHPQHSHIWQWHYVIGIIWAVCAGLHALFFKIRGKRVGKNAATPAKV